LITKIKFITSKGRQSIYFGIQGDVPDVWECNGKALAGFAGAHGEYMNGLMALWSFRSSSIGPEALSKLIEEARIINSDIDKGTVRYNQLSSDTTKIQNDLDVGLKPLVSSAVDGMNILGQSIVDLYNVPDKSGTSATNLIAKCKGQGQVVARRFDNLHTHSQDILRRAGDVAIEATNAVTVAEKQLKRVGEMLEISSAMRVNAETVRQLRENRIQEANRSIENAQRTRREAEDKKRQNETTRIVRDIFTFGLGEVGDWGGINAAIDYANKLIESCEQNLRACQAALQQAQSDLQRIQNEISSYQSLQERLNGYTPRILDQEKLANALRERLNTVQNNALDVARYLSVLAAQSTTIQLGLSAQELAQKVLALQLSMDVKRPQGLLWDKPADLEKTLEAISTSPVPAIDVGDLL